MGSGMIPGVQYSYISPDKGLQDTTRQLKPHELPQMMMQTANGNPAVVHKQSSASKENFTAPRGGDLMDAQKQIAEIEMLDSEFDESKDMIPGKSTSKRSKLKQGGAGPGGKKYNNLAHNHPNSVPKKLSEVTLPSHETSIVSKRGMKVIVSRLDGTGQRLESSR